MPEFMDVHHDMAGLTSEQLAEAHRADLAIQSEENVDFKHAWADPDSGVVFCLSEAPNEEAVKKVHQRAGHPTDEVYRVPLQA
ncbi:SCO4226 family nickel-binding protein [Saccharopolyspora sp. WRP15-2]|uniref:SCO4226 family nickel-binding protein n=1 Tax=Saccharopolyspora oryzae TaxID=2997343 RepID=A0ABT4V3W6_9PSEU|nr:SCO4226 family nickel-binding protein [Saccharopolyspora oryzae]MDA3628657.1 SCO4226 family nickel-binding protein [Saccharopolyspora oryzae]